MQAKSGRQVWRGSLPGSETFCSGQLFVADQARLKPRLELINVRRRW